ncbi:carbonic anhydrase 1 isoform X2 [Osmia bicornis bicornis]|uniref:carbonic anhydrase 1 isoform X2 n=1 Tax=Osmia bicornis bicornis TaxID=1437191 RepID=UPI001EAF2485|nr:carbonic anhydrase 1 isoform X2 [Osmia bicornis bicornis]
MGLQYFIFLLTFFYSGLYTATGADWTYSGEHGPEHWPGLCTIGKKQSPINVVTEDAVKTDLGKLKFIRYSFAFSVEVTNNGHSVKIQLDGAPIHLEGANLPNSYILEQMHFHWPAEHTIDENRDVLELHFVHYSNKYNNTSMAAQYDKGIAVVATLFELSNEDNMDIMPIIKATELVSKGVGKTTELKGTKVIPFLFLPKDHTTYYHYDGSLTTPGCQESVMWFILSEKLSISEPQLNVFKNVGTENGTLSFNYRPTQPLEERTVYHHLEGYSAASTLPSNLLLTCLSLLLCKLLHSK